jgi:hypothetical protein
MKALPIIALLVGFVGFGVTAQTSTKSNYPYTIISKDVQKIQFRKVEHIPAKITLVSPVVLQSKGSAQLLAKVADSKERPVVRVGYPAWSISKGVARRQYQKSQTR